MTKTTKTPNLDTFKRWARTNAPVAKAVLLAQAFAELERERIDAYILPVFNARTFPVKAEWAETYGELVKTPKDLYLCDDEALCAEYFDACDAAHRANGFTGHKGHCPALIAENLLIKAQNALIDVATPLFGVESCDLFGDNRKKYLDLLIGACVKADKE